MFRRFPGSNLHAKVLLTVLAVLTLPQFATAGQQSTRPDPAKCQQYTKPTIHMTAGETGQTVKLDDLIDKQDQYYGKIVTVEGEMHRIFTDRVFTIEDDDLIRDDDVLIISDVPRAQAVVALEKSIDPGKNVRVTGFVHKYNQLELECLYGPLQTESREGHSFTKSPVLIVQKVQVAEARPAPETPPTRPVAAARPEPAPAPAPQPPAVAQSQQAPAPAAERAPAEESRALPETAGSMPLVGLLGVASVLAAFAIRKFQA
jgi:hypothetical protein